MIKQSVPPTKYNQPIRDYVGRTLHDEKEIVDFVPQSHLRIWYNTQTEGYNTHHHSAAEIVYCIENFYQVTVGGTVYNLNPDDILFIPPDTLHSIRGGDGIRLIFLIDLMPLHDLEEFNAIYEHLLLMQKHTEEESERLASLRDTLLPRLMSSELKVNEIENVI